MPDKLKGLIAASHTPMHEDGSINFGQIEHQARWYQSNPIDGAFICGTTGEGKLLTFEERKRVAECWMESSRGEFPVIVHVGDDCMEYCQSLARHAEDIGAFAISTVAPTYYRPSHVSDLTGYCREVASSAPHTPFYFYHIPSLTHVYFSMFDFLSLGAKEIPTLAGIKYTHNDFVDLFACLRLENHRFNILFGRDELLLAALIYGIDGAVGSTYNYAAPLYKRLIQEYQNGNLDEARNLQSLSIELVRLVTQYNEIAVGKAIMTWLGVNCGSVRQPLKGLNEEQRQSIQNSLAASAIHPYLCKHDLSSVN